MIFQFGFLNIFTTQNTHENIADPKVRYTKITA